MKKKEKDDRVAIAIKRRHQNFQTETCGTEKKTEGGGKKKPESRVAQPLFQRYLPRRKKRKRKEKLALSHDVEWGAVGRVWDGFRGAKKGGGSLRSAERRKGGRGSRASLICEMRKKEISVWLPI